MILTQFLLLTRMVRHYSQLTQEKQGYYNAHLGLKRLDCIPIKFIHRSDGYLYNFTQIDSDLLQDRAI